jgi:hypothetical protein
MFWTLISWLQFYISHKFLGALDVKKQTFFGTDTNGKFLVMDPDNLTFFIEKPENKSSLFLLLRLLLYYCKNNFDT